LTSTDQPLFIPDVANTENLDEMLRSRWLSAGFKGMVIIPLGQVGQWLGVLTFGWSEPHEFSDQEQETFEGLINLITPVVQSRRLFDQAQTRAAREHALREITAAVRGSTDPATIMRTAVRELGTALGRRTQIRFEQLDDSDNDNSNS
jgi:GAF domain-containing protein